MRRLFFWTISGICSVGLLLSGYFYGTQRNDHDLLIRVDERNKRMERTLTDIKLRVEMQGIEPQSIHPYGRQ